MPPVCFIDNDIVLKLVACDLFWEAMTCLELSPTDLRFLPRAKYIFKNSNKIKQKYPQIIRDAAIYIVENCPKVQIEESEELKKLSQIEGIDSGEAFLISATRNETFFYLTTGDKRCLEALAVASQLIEIKQRITGRVVCFEQLILKLIDTQGFDEILPKVLPAREYDKALNAIFGSGERATQRNVLEALEGYIKDLQKRTGKILANL